MVINIIFWVIVFIISLALMLKSSDWLLEKSEKIGLAIGISPFIVGVIIVGAGTSFPELLSALMAIWEKAPEIVVANAFGSNIANILLVGGASAAVARRIIVTKSLIDLDLPLLAISTSLALAVTWDRQVTWFEALILVSTYIIYLFYAMSQREQEDADIEKVGDLPDILPASDSKNTKNKSKKEKQKKISRPKVNGRDFFILTMGMAGLFFGSRYLIKSVIEISTLINISTELIAITAIALGTSLPELLVSIKAAFQGKAEIAIGNIFGSNVFNLMLVIGIPGLITDLPLDEKTFTIGLPALIISTLLFTISGISRKIHIWEGLMYLVAYGVFAGKLFGLF